VGLLLLHVHSVKIAALIGLFFGPEAAFGQAYLAKSKGIW